MDWSAWLGMDWQQVVMIFISALGVYVGLMFYTRLMGLRSFSKLSSHDFAMTVGVGSILASTVLSKDPSLLQGLVAMACLFIFQAVVSMLRRKVKPIKKLVDNQAIILMAHGEYIAENLKKANLAKSDIQEVLRKNGLKNPAQVFAVVMETTGDMSVIKQDDQAPDMQMSLFDDIRDYEILLKDKPIKNRS
ncbi:DUF421 domain-containing protein [Psychrobacter sp. I-STPA10]|uniref:DUF421 domain-containing protein n=1 Tax=Psychrobacter sp. I-STPA10 TaxID=2585769 RepID=UPI001E587DA6|nr:YetF domain-containing protein [Psychrobacter sp. I-STPA10]